jgi:hypothetical protein
VAALDRRSLHGHRAGWDHGFVVESRDSFRDAGFGCAPRSAPSIRPGACTPAGLFDAAGTLMKGSRKT